MNDLQSLLNELMNNLAKIVLDSRLNDDIDREEAQEIAQFILEEKRKISSAGQIDGFLNKLKEKYYFIFRDFVDNYLKQKEAQTKDQQTIEKVKQQLLNLVN
ncbi:MAG: hypothetical protein N2482_02995 [Patescibacteria group bacterium]|nr:hypothetical protein [Patescibacteria group bacterium]